MTIPYENSSKTRSLTQAKHKSPCNETGWSTAQTSSPSHPPTLTVLECTEECDVKECSFYPLPHPLLPWEVIYTTKSHCLNTGSSQLTNTWRKPKIKPAAANTIGGLAITPGDNQLSWRNWKPLQRGDRRKIEAIKAELERKLTLNRCLTSAVHRKPGVGGWVIGWMDEWVGRRVDGWMGGWVDGWADRWMDEWVDRWTVRWMDFHIYLQHPILATWPLYPAPTTC